MRKQRGCAALAVVLVSGCSSSPPKATRHEVVVRTEADPAAVVQPAREYATGHFQVRVLTVRCGIDSIVGTHAEFTPTHPLCDIRIRVRSDDATFHTFSPPRQQLLGAAGEVVPTAPDVMQIRRQAQSVQLGARNVVELDLWFEPPTAMRVAALRVFGDSDVDPGGSSAHPAAAPSVDVPLILSQR